MQEEYEEKDIAWKSLRSIQAALVSAPAGNVGESRTNEYP
jgi:hypothetical protein